jgi:hypothetical protein
MEWTEFLKYASGSGVAVIVGVLLSEVIATYWPGFKALAARWKRVVFFVLCLVVPILASVLGVATAGWPGTWVATYWPALVAGAVAFGSGTLVHTRKMTGKAELLAQLVAARTQIRDLQAYQTQAYQSQTGMDTG